MSLSKSVDDVQASAQTQRLFALSKGLRRIQVEELAPALFNRFGDSLKGTRVLEIIKLVLVKPGFAEYIYDHAWVTTPDLNGGYQIADNANRMAAFDPFLPRHARVPLYGTFRKSHLAAALLIIKRGAHTWPNTGQLITAEQGNDCLRETLQQGMWCKVWSHEDAYAEANLEFFKLLMASDNWAADEQMADDELAVLNRIFECTATVHASEVGAGVDQAIINKVQKICSTAWSLNELYGLLDYAKTSTLAALELLRNFQRLTTDPTQFNVPVRHFRDVVEFFGVEYQRIRISFACAMYVADRKNAAEVKQVWWPRQDGADRHFQEALAVCQGNAKS